MTPADVVHRLFEIEVETVRGLGLDVSAYPSCVAAVRAYLASCQQRSPTVEAKISLPDPALQGVFEALCARYDIPVYRRPRQRKTTFTVAGPGPFVHHVLSVMFQPNGRSVRRIVRRPGTHPFVPKPVPSFIPHRKHQQTPVGNHANGSHTGLEVDLQNLGRGARRALRLHRGVLQSEVASRGTSGAGSAQRTSKRPLRVQPRCPLNRGNSTA